MHRNHARSAAVGSSTITVTRSRCPAAACIGVVAVLLGLATPGSASAATHQDFTTEAFQNDCLNAHNMYRKQHDASALTIDQKLVAFAIGRAKTLAITETMKHDAQGYGENLAWKWSSRGANPVPCTVPVKEWYSEVKEVDWSDPESLPKAPRFTQVVWRATTKLGCGQAATVNGRQGGVWTVCVYDPAGNMPGKFSDNVHRSS
ncbi:CAP family protein [Nocardia sp. NPDC051570]|uniref:CAP family protein n=1 Tax=Nocardia sp. NPDC051570 TaxID=3364324 RepID=UPI0037B1C42D